MYMSIYFYKNMLKHSDNEDIMFCKIVSFMIISTAKFNIRC